MGLSRSKTKGPIFFIYLFFKQCRVVDFSAPRSRVSSKAFYVRRDALTFQSSFIGKREVGCGHDLADDTGMPYDFRYNSSVVGASNCTFRKARAAVVDPDGMNLYREYSCCCSF